MSDLMLLLSVAKHALETELTARLGAELGISPRENCVLSQALNQERTQKELAELSNMDKTTMVVTMDALEKAGLAERRPSETDRRARIVSVTPAGAAMIEKAAAVVQSIYDDVLSDLPAKERAAFLNGLEHLAHGRLSSPTPCGNAAPRRRAVR